METTYPICCLIRYQKDRLNYIIAAVYHIIGLYRDVWIAAIASSRTRLATLMGAMCKTFVTRKFGNVERNSHCDVLHITPIRVARLFLDCNDDFAIKAYRNLM